MLSKQACLRAQAAAAAAAFLPKQYVKADSGLPPVLYMPSCW
jgi:hypothetical protein